MSRLRRSSTDEGFSLVEILVAIMIFGIVATAVLPLLLAGIRGGTHAKLTTQAKNLAQERLELMRSLPYYIAQQNGDYRDVLDIYFRDLANPGAIGVGDPCVARSYNAAARSYACTLPNQVIGSATFSQVVRSTFVDAQNAVVTPRSTYNSQTANLDAPAAARLAVAVTTTWTQGDLSRDFVLRSSIVNSATDAPLITSKASASAVKVSSTTSTGDVLQFEAGLLSADGSKSTASSANATAVGAHASLSSGTSAAGATVSLSAPPDDVLTSLPSATALPLGIDCVLVCFGDTAITGAAAAKVSGGFPQVGIHGPASYLGSELSRTTGFGARGFDYSNTDLASAAAAVGVSRLPLVSAGTGTGGAIAGSRGSLTAVSTGTTSVTSSVSSSAQTLQLFPTASADAGIVQLRLNHVSLTCVDGGSAPGVTADWEAVVSVHTTSGYTTHVVKPGGAALPALTTITSSGQPLSHYIRSWSGLLGSASSVGQATASGVSGSIPGVLKILTAPTRSGDEDSLLNITVGSLSCEAVDNQ